MQKSEPEMIYWKINHGLNNNTEMCVENISTTRSEKLSATKSRKRDTDFLVIQLSRDNANRSPSFYIVFDDS